jgi:ATP-dependent RNA helicase DeaD
MSFSSAHPPLLRALQERGYTEATAVQAAVLGAPPDRDLLVSAQTGSGKTVAFGLVLARRLLGEAERFGQAGAPLALVVAPTRELALQVQRELHWLLALTGARVQSCVGGMDISRERRGLSGGAHVVVGTPGRLRDHLERGALDLSRVRVVVLDEADEMLDLGFREELESLLDATPTERQTLMFSATVPNEIEALATTYQRDAMRIATAGSDQPHADIEYRCVVCAPQEREHAVVNTLRYLDPKSAIVFCMTREGVSHLAANLNERGFAVVAMSGELSQSERNRALQALRDGAARVCVATDVAARGLDLRDLDLVIHADLPREAQTLLHRSGRTGRAGRKGTAVLIVPYNKRRFAERLVQEAGVDTFWSPPPTADAIRELDQQRLVARVAELTVEVPEEDRAVAKTLLEGGDPEALVAALVRSLRSEMPAPEEILPPAERAPTPRPRAAQHPADEAWFRLNVGRAENADPRWILPLLCRRGRVHRDDIGKIVIFAHETRFAINPAVAHSFADAVRRPDSTDRNIRIVPLG